MIIYSTIDMLTSFWVWLEPASAQVSNGVNDDKTTRWTGLPWFQTNLNTARSVFVQRRGNLPWTKYYNWFHHPKVLDCKQWTIENPWKFPSSFWLKISMVFVKSPCVVRKSRWNPIDEVFTALISWNRWTPSWRRWRGRPTSPSG